MEKPGQRKKANIRNIKIKRKKKTPKKWQLTKSIMT